MWNPSLPEGETEETQEEHRNDLMTTYHQSRKDWNYMNIKQTIVNSFYLQRKDINGDIEVTASRTGKHKKRKIQQPQNTENIDADDPAAESKDCQLKI